MGIYTVALQQMYVAYFNRPADVSGLAYWEDVVTSGKGSTAAVAAAFAGSAEYKAAYANMDESHVVAQVYQNLFGRSPEQAGLNFWSQALINKQMTIDNVVTQIAAGAQGSDLSTYNNRVTAATSFTAALNTPDEALAYSGDKANDVGKMYIAGVTDSASLAAAIADAALAATIASLLSSGPQPDGSTYSLTGGQDTMVGGAGNDTFNVVLDDANGVTAGKPAATLTPSDSIDGGAGKNTLNVVDYANAGVMSLPASATIKNIAVANVQSLEAVGTSLAAPASFAGWTGLTALNINSSKGADFINAAGTTAVKVVDSTGTVSVVGGSTVNVTTDASAVGVVGAAGATTSVTTNSTGTVIVVDGNSSVAYAGNAVTNAHAAPATATANTITSVSATGATTVTVYSDALTSLTLNGVTGSVDPVAVVNAAAGSRSLTLNLTKTTNALITDNNATALTINATGTKSTGLAISANAAKSIILGGDASLALGAASIMAGNAATASIVGAGGFSGGLAGLKATAAIDASASTGTNSVTIGASQTYKGGAGADTVTLTAVPGVAVDGGAGSNTLALKNIGDLSTLTSTALAAATNFQTLQLTGNIGTAPGGTVAEGTLDLSGLTTGMVNVVLNGAALEALTLSNGAANTAITILAAPTQAVTYTQKTDTSSDSLALTMGNGTNAAISTAAGGVVFTADKIENVTIHSNADTSVAAVTNMLNAHLAAATTLTIDGAAGLDLTHSTLTKVTTIDGHASTGNLILAASGVTSGVTITTGSGNDTIFGSAIAKTATNAATVDTIRAGDGNNAITELHGNNVITAGTGSDQIMAGDGNNTITTTTIKAGLHSAIGIAGGNNTIMSGDVAGSGNMVVTEAVAVGVVGGNNTITLGHGTADSVTLMDGNNTVTVGNGGDMVWVGNGNNTIVSGNGIDLIKVGTGMNVVTTGGGRNATSGAADVIEFTDANQAVNTYTTINDFTTKGEKLQFETVVLALTAGADITSNVNAGAAAFQDYADYAFKNSAQNTVDWFAYKGDTYVVVHESAGTSFVSGMDIIVKLVGAVDLSAATFGAGTIIHG